MDEKTLNIEVSRLIERSFEKVVEMVKNGGFHRPKPRKSPEKAEKSAEKPEKPEENIRKKLYYARLWPEIAKNSTIRRENQEKRAKSVDEFRNFYRDYLKEKPLFVRKAEHFRLQEKIRSEREKTRVFRELKDFYKPHDLLEFQRHADKYRSIRLENRLKRGEKIDEIHRSFERQGSEKHWQGSAHKRLRQELMNSRVLCEKLEKSGKKEEKPAKNGQKQREIGLEYLDFSKKFARERPRLKTQNKSADYLDKLLKKGPVIYKNYLCELRIANNTRTSRRNEPRKGHYESWRLDFNDSSLKSAEKYAKVLNKAEFLDCQALQFEKQVKYCCEDLEARHRLNELLISSISAKIAVLKDL